MPEAWMLIVVLMSLAAVPIVGILAVLALRRRRRRCALMRAFLQAIDDGRLRATRRRSKPIFGEGFADSYQGTSGTLTFRLDVRVEPRKAQSVTISLFAGDDACGGERYERWQFIHPEEGPLDVLQYAYESVRAAVDDADARPEAP